MLKKLLDKLISLIALILLAPIMLVVWVRLLWEFGWPAIFVQSRIGYMGQTFRILKFQTMKESYTGEGVPLSDEKRLTKFGTLTRATSLDELPTLVNVLKGDMGLVGPRPLLTKYRYLYTPEQFRRHSVTPGLTGWAQINGRNNLSWEEKFALDLWYVDNYSLLLDLKILLGTISYVMQRKDINKDGHATMEEFKG
jgi:sugar transferase EpsL